MNGINKAAQELGRRGGKKSIEKRFAGKTEKEISDIMRRARLSPEERKDLDKMAQEAVDNLNKNVE